MERKPAQRRLAAILAADVVGYSRLMSVDEMGTLMSLKAHRRELIDPAIAGHHGRIVKTTGDGALVEFGSVVDAVQCAVAIQRGVLSRNAGISEDKRIVFRIGVNVGDIIIDDGDIFGDGVNIAARLQTLCEPGGLCISRAANDQIRDKLAVAAGVDGVTWHDYEADLEPRIEDLHGRVHRGAYRPQPSRRTYIPKADGKQRPLAIAALEDKVVQGATVMALNAIYEGDFCGFSALFVGFAATLPESDFSGSCTLPRVCG